METEKRLIDADKLLEKVQFRLPIDNQNAEVIAGCVAITRRLIENAPTVDAVEVVRCKDCKHWVYTDETRGDCTNPRFHIPGIVDPTMNCDEYCALGERRNNEN